MYTYIVVYYHIHTLTHVYLHMYIVMNVAYLLSCLSTCVKPVSLNKTYAMIAVSRQHRNTMTEDCWAAGMVGTSLTLPAFLLGLFLPGNCNKPRNTWCSVGALLSTSDSSWVQEKLLRAEVDCWWRHELVLLDVVTFNSFWRSFCNIASTFTGILHDLASYRCITPVANTHSQGYYSWRSRNRQHTRVSSPLFSEPVEY